MLHNHSIFLMSQLGIVKYCFSYIYIVGWYTYVSNAPLPLSPLACPSNYSKPSTCDIYIYFHD